MTKPIKPQDLPERKLISLPDAVVEAFNDLIVKHWDGRHSSKFTQDAVVALIATKMDCTRAAVFENGWLNVEDVFRKANWRVRYDKPGFNETYAATFEFTSTLRGHVYPEQA